MPAQNVVAHGQNKMNSSVLHLETKTCGRRFLSFGRRPQAFNTNLRSQVGVKTAGRGLAFVGLSVRI